MKRILIFFALIMLWSAGISQDQFRENEKITVSLSNKERITGTVIGSDDTFLYLLVGQEKVSIPHKSIVYYVYGDGKDVSGSDSDKGYRDYVDQYFLTPSAIPVNPGEIYYRNIDLVANLFSMGLSKNFSINAGVETASIFAGEFPIMVVTPKFSIPAQKNLHFGLGASAFFNDDDFGSFLFTNVTIGDRRNNFTLGIGVGSDGDEFNTDPLIIGGFHFSLSERVSFYGDILATDAIDDDISDGLLSANFRIKFKGGVAFDIGAIAPSDFDFGIPSVAVVLPIK